MTLFWRSGRSLRVARKNGIHELDEAVRQRRAVELEKVFRVVLAGMRQVVTAGEYGVVDHGDLGVHEVMDAARRVGRGDLGRERESGAHRLKGRSFPGRVGIDPPLAE